MIGKMKRGMKKALLWTLGILGVLILGVAIWLGPVISDFAKAGFFEKQAERTYDGTKMEDLKNIHQALMLYHESEGILPSASGWMDAAWRRLQTADMSEDEAKKKLQAEGVAEGEYGYAMNEDVAEMYTGDIENPAETPLVFDSSKTGWNAHGKPGELAPDPERPGGNKAVTVEGNVVDLKDSSR